MGANLSVLNLVIIERERGGGYIPELTDTTVPQLLESKRASRVNKPQSL